jgi:hypothetical protein
MSDEHHLVIFRTVGDPVAFDPQAQMWSLTAMHQAAGGQPNQAPAQWLANAQTAGYLAALMSKYAPEAHLNLAPRPEGGRDGRTELLAWVQQVREIAEQAGLLDARRGNHGGTWAHWQLAAAYAHYLDPAFYLQWNEWALAYRTNQAKPQASSALEARVATLEARVGTAGGGRRSRITARRVVERVVEEVVLEDVPHRPLSAAIIAVLRQAGRPLLPIEVTALLQAAGVAVTHPTQVSGGLWHLADRYGTVARDEHGRYRLDDEVPF